MLSQKTIDIVKSTAPILAERGVEITSVFYKRLFEKHPELLNIFNHANQKKGRQQAALANTVYAAAEHIDRLEVILPAVKQIAYKHRSLGVKPEHYPIVGENLLAAIKEVLGHAATDDIIQAWGEAYGVIAQAFIDIEKEMYLEAKEQTGGWAGFKAFKVVKKEIESSVITSFYLKPADGSNVPDYLPGQYISVRLQIEGEAYLFNRQYTLSDSPGKGYFRISVKREADGHFPHGQVSNYLHDHVEIGDEIEVSAPAGEFVLDQGTSPVYLLGGGVGITPLMSMLNDLANKKSARQTVFIQASKNGEMTAFRNEVKEKMDSLPNGESYLFLENPTSIDRQDGGFDHQGFIGLAFLETIIKDPNAKFYICGPVPFMKAMIENLEQLGIKEANIHYEFFGPSLNLKEKQFV
ncbi:NO-inducible flavohemoprotein [Metabacillus arenae]|uniref:Flavohemoprotein n=1 Tax=Metabacillus arenae TaxID=2771434 RepID=A0A926NJK2_9BACI|nr:NO-inducible flavohemoprotein [Metabacillus arenae]MBD1382255.1 NO-inducible flavohemoprotein [Metabacillus arenae]